MTEHQHDHLGCCGYDEIEQKPQTTSPIFSIKAKAIGLPKEKDGPMQTRRISFMGSPQAAYPILNKELR